MPSPVLLILPGYLQLMKDQTVEDDSQQQCQNQPSNHHLDDTLTLQMPAAAPTMSWVASYASVALPVQQPEPTTVGKAHYRHAQQLWQLLLSQLCTAGFWTACALAAIRCTRGLAGA